MELATSGRKQHRANEKMSYFDDSLFYDLLRRSSSSCLWPQCLQVETSRVCL